MSSRNSRLASVSVIWILSLSYTLAYQLPSGLPALFKDVQRSDPTYSQAAPQNSVPIVISSCQTITSPGDYVLSQDLTTQDGCISIINVSNVNLECSGHAIVSTSAAPSIVVASSTHVVISGCTAHKSHTISPSYELGIFESSSVNVANNDLETVIVQNAANLQVLSNHILGAYSQVSTTNAVIENNDIVYEDQAGSGAAVIYSLSGDHNQFLANHIDGKWNGQFPVVRLGADDGIRLDGEHDDVVYGNVIQNVWDAGIETLFFISNTVIQSNRIQNAAFTGIGAFYDTGWNNNVISGNYVTNSPVAIYVEFLYRYGFPNPSTINFQNNLFEKNVFTSPFSFTGTTSYNNSINIVLVDPMTGVAAVPLVAGNNTISNNFLPTYQPGPLLLPTSAFTDGGGNHCGQPPVGSPISCESSAKQFATPAITSTGTGVAQIGVAYSYQLSASGGTPPYGDWTITSGFLPAGLSLNASTGVISGTPTGKATIPYTPYFFSVTVKDSANQSSPAQLLEVTVSPGNAGQPCAYSLSPEGQVFIAPGGSGTISVTAGPNCSWTVSGAPDWVMVNGASSGLGNGSISYNVSANLGPGRSGALTVAGESFVVEQASTSTAGLSFAGSIAQLASGGGWDTTLTLVNTYDAPGEAVSSFFGNDGSPLQLPFAFPQLPPPATTLLVASTLDRTLSPNGLLVFESQQSSNLAAEVGSAQLLTDGNIAGFAIFKYTPTGQEAVVPLETRNAPSYMIAYDNTGGLATGVAIANGVAHSANIPVVIRDDTGAQIGTDTITLRGQGHTSFMLTGNYAVTAGKRGTIEFDTPASGQITALGLRANGSALTTLPVLAQVTAGGGSMAQVASGGGWQTTFTLVNTGTSSAQAQLSFFDKNGYALPLPLTFVQSGATTTASTVSQTIAAGATLVVLTQGINAGTSVVGSAQLTTTGNVGGFAIFRYNPTGQEAVVALETRNASGYVLVFDNTNGLVTGVALANVSNEAANVPVVLRDDAGFSIGTATINVAAHGHTSFVLTTIGYASVANIRGTLEFDTPAGSQISVLGLRATPSGAVTTVPVLAK